MAIWNSLAQAAAFPEALLLHYLDDMDSKMEAMRALLKTTARWRAVSPLQSALERPA